MFNLNKYKSVYLKMRGEYDVKTPSQKLQYWFQFR